MLALAEEREGSGFWHPGLLIPLHGQGCVFWGIEQEDFMLRASWSPCVLYPRFAVGSLCAALQTVGL